MTGATQASQKWVGECSSVRDLADLKSPCEPQNRPGKADDCSQKGIWNMAPRAHFFLSFSAQGVAWAIISSYLWPNPHHHTSPHTSSRCYQGNQRLLAAWRSSPAARQPAGGCCKKDLAPEKKELLAQVKVQNLISYDYKILTDHKPHPQSPLSQVARHSWQTFSHPSPCSRANPG